MIGRLFKKSKGGENIMNYNFSDALMLLKDGNRLCRKNWNGKNMYIFIIKNWTYTNEINDNYENLPFIAMKTFDEKIVPWLASQTDILSNDWEIVYLT
jgi:hypothetical protein